MSTIVFETATVKIPDWVEDLPSFLRWEQSDAFPVEGRICYVGEVWVDMTKEQFFSHNQIKSEFNLVLALLAKSVRRGRWIPDGMLVVNDDADLASRPDGAFVSHESLQSGRVRLVEGAKAGFVELEGSPDMALEVISDGSVHKDTVLLRDLYWRAKIDEYWLVDARGDRLDFQILQHADAQYQPVASEDGWLRSEVFGRSFQLRRDINEIGHPEYTLAVRE